MAVKLSKVNLFLLLMVPCFLITGSAVGNFRIEKPEHYKAADNKNVIVITISSLRADHISCLGYNRDTTPNFDAFAEENILFTNAFATSSWMMPSVGSMFTSLYPSRHGATHIDKRLDRQAHTLAEILKDNGFYTAGFCSNPRLSSEYGFGQGFDFYDDYSVSMILKNMSFGQEQSFDINKKRTNGLINDAVIRWLQNNTHRPFFLFVHFYDTHWDYLPPAPFDTLYDPDYEGKIDGTEIAREPLYSNKPSDEDVKHIIALYDGEVKQTDTDLGDLLKFLKEAGRFEDSIVIVASDHGEQFYEHGHTSHHGIFDELIHIPMTMAVPDLHITKTIDSFVNGVDVMPTILDFLNVPVPVICQGKSIRPLITGEKEKVNDFIFVEYTGGAVPDAFAVRFNRFKFVQQEGKIFTYDLCGDPLEQRKIYQHDFTELMSQKFETIKNLLVNNSKQ